MSGSRGFIGSRLFTQETAQQYELDKHTFRGLPEGLPQGDVYVHLAAIAHADHPDTSLLNTVNRDLPIHVATMARDAGYQQFVFMSSALVWGSNFEVVSQSTPEKPDSSYGRAKLEAEEGLRKLGSSDFRIAIIRPPLVYGPAVKGNLAKLLSAVHHWPVCPLGDAENRRSLVNVDNLAALIFHLIDRNISGTFCATDSEPLSSLGILQKMADRMPKHGRIVAMPKPFRWGLQSLAPGTARRLLGSFVIEDDSANRIGFEPPFTMDQGFDAMVATYLAEQGIEGNRSR